MSKPLEALPRDEWITRCMARMLTLDPLALPEELAPIVADLADRIRWREHEPERAADLLFGPINDAVRWPPTVRGGLSGPAGDEPET